MQKYSEACFQLRDWLLHRFLQPENFAPLIEQTYWDPEITTSMVWWPRNQLSAIGAPHPSNTEKLRTLDNHREGLLVAVLEDFPLKVSWEKLQVYPEDR